MKHHLMQCQGQRVLWDTSGYAMDSLEYFYNTVSVENEDVMLAALETQKGNYSEALSLLGNCQVDGRTDDKCAVQKIIATAKKNDQFCPAFTQHQLTDLYAIAEDEKSPASTMARSLLRQHADTTWAIDIRITHPLRSMELQEDDDYTRRKHFVEVHPNPAQGEAYFTAQIPEGVESARIILSDSFGKKVWESAVEGHQIISLNLGDYQSGVYIYTLMMDGVRTESDKLIISR